MRSRWSTIGKGRSSAHHRCCRDRSDHGPAHTGLATAFRIDRARSPRLVHGSLGRSSGRGRNGAYPNRGRRKKYPFLLQIRHRSSLGGRERVHSAAPGVTSTGGAGGRDMRRPRGMTIGGALIVGGWFAAALAASGPGDRARAPGRVVKVSTRSKSESRVFGYFEKRSQTIRFFIAIPAFIRLTSTASAGLMIPSPRTMKESNERSIAEQTSKSSRRSRRSASHSPIPDLSLPTRMAMK